MDESRDREEIPCLFHLKDGPVREKEGDYEMRGMQLPSYTKYVDRVDSVVVLCRLPVTT